MNNYRHVERITLALLVSVFFVSCAKKPKVYVQSNTTEINRTISADNSLQDFINPYRDSVSREMDEVIGEAAFNLERGRPEGTLGNFVADLTLKRAIQEGWVKPEQNPIVIMNHGGLRSPISKGDIKRGDIFKLMPFDNTIVVLQLPASRLNEILAYIQFTGGQPISGFSIKDGQVVDRERFGDVLTVVTTDYLASGGDKMTFFEQPLHAEYYPLLLRDVIIKHVMHEKHIAPELDGRIRLNE